MCIKIQKKFLFHNKRLDTFFYHLERKHESNLFSSEVNLDKVIAKYTAIFEFSFTYSRIFIICLHFIKYMSKSIYKILFLFLSIILNIPNASANGGDELEIAVSVEIVVVGKLLGS